MEKEPENSQVDATEHAKPKLTVDEQIARLKSKGITFDICTEDDAKYVMAEESYWFNIAAYRTLYDKQIDGEHEGCYINLDFAYLADLAAIDKQLRQTLLPMTLDVEHYAISKIERIVSERDDEDGYSIVVDYWNSMTDDRREHRTAEIKRLREDFYCGKLLEQYRSSMPVWVFMELLTFGAFIDFYGFCAKRWDDQEMRQDHYTLRAVKSARNAYAHSCCIINNFRRTDIRHRTSVEVMKALENAGVSKQVRNKRMKNVAMQQIATLMFAQSRFVTGSADKKKASASLQKLCERMDEHSDYYLTNNVVTSAFEFLKKIFTLAENGL